VRKDEDDRPWESLGALRRDYEPHRGVQLLGVAVFVLLCSLAGAYVLILAAAEAQFPTLAAFVPPLNVAALWAGVWVRKAAAHDMALMQKGEMDRTGAGLSMQASGPALGSIILNASLLPVSVASCLKVVALG
jgi:hypothetical protein